MIGWKVAPDPSWTNELIPSLDYWDQTECQISLLLVPKMVKCKAQELWAELVHIKIHRANLSGGTGSPDVAWLLGVSAPKPDCLRILLGVWLFHESSHNLSHTVSFCSPVTLGWVNESPYYTFSLINKIPTCWRGALLSISNLLLKICSVQAC